MTMEFKNIGSFIAHLAKAEIAETLELHAAMKKAAMAVEKTAKEEIGHYQPEVEYFPGWVQLAPSTLEYHDRMGVGDSPLLVTGELYASIGHEVQALDAFVGSTSDVMVYQELGTEKIPPRPVLGPAALRNKEKIEKLIGLAAAAGLLYGAGSTLTSLE